MPKKSARKTPHQIKGRVDKRWKTERRWTIHRGGAQCDCALLYNGTAEVEVQVSSSGSWLSSLVCESREAAVVKAEELRERYLREGGLLIM